MSDGGAAIAEEFHNKCMELDQELTYWLQTKLLVEKRIEAIKEELKDLNDRYPFRAKGQENREPPF